MLEERQRPSVVSLRRVSYSHEAKNTTHTTKGPTDRPNNRRPRPKDRPTDRRPMSCRSFVHATCPVQAVAAYTDLLDLSNRFSSTFGVGKVPATKAQVQYARDNPPRPSRAPARPAARRHTRHTTRGTRQAAHRTAHRTLHPSDWAGGLFVGALGARSVSSLLSLPPLKAAAAAVVADWRDGRTVGRSSRRSQCVFAAVAAVCRRCDRRRRRRRCCSRRRGCTWAL